LAGECFVEVATLAVAAVAKPPLGLVRDRERMRLELRQQVPDVARCGLQQKPPDLFGWLSWCGMGER
jgi:hypothetical protein